MLDLPFPKILMSSRGVRLMNNLNAQFYVDEEYVFIEKFPNGSALTVSISVRMSHAEQKFIIASLGPAYTFKCVGTMMRCDAYTNEEGAMDIMKAFAPVVSAIIIID